MFKKVTMNGGNRTSKSFLALLCLLAFAARTSRTNEVCSEFFYLGGKFGTHRGSFSSPGYPSGTYPSRERCTWIVKVPMDYRVGLYFSDFDIEYCPSKEQNCTCDYVEVTDGQLRIDRLLAKFCGSEIPPTVYSSGQFVRVDLVSDESKTRKGFQAHFYSISPDGATPSGTDVDTDKNQKSVPTPTGLPKEGGNSTVMIAVICSLLGVVVIGSILLFIYCKKRKPPQERQPRPAQLQMARPVSNASQRNHSAQLPSESPPPYSSVVATAPPPYSTAATMPSQSNIHIIPEVL